MSPFLLYDCSFLCVFRQGAKAAPLLARYAFKKLSDWEADIATWQAPVLNDPTVPTFYKVRSF